MEEWEVIRNTVSKEDLEHYKNNRYKGTLGQQEVLLKTIRAKCKPKDFRRWARLTEEEKQKMKTERNNHPDYMSDVERKLTWEGEIVFMEMLKTGTPPGDQPSKP